MVKRKSVSKGKLFYFSTVPPVLSRAGELSPTRLWYLNAHHYSLWSKAFTAPVKTGYVFMQGNSKPLPPVVTPLLLVSETWVQIPGV